MKKMILILAMIGATANAARLSDKQLEAKARYAAQLNFQQAMIEGNAWHQEIFHEVLTAPAKVEIDPANGAAATITLNAKGSLCTVVVSLEADTGYTSKPIDYACAEF